MPTPVAAAMAVGLLVGLPATILGLLAISKAPRGVIGVVCCLGLLASLFLASRWAYRAQQKWIEEYRANYPALFGLPGPGAGPERPTEGFRALLELPKPRTVRMDWKAKCEWTVTFLSVTAFQFLLIYAVVSEWEKKASWNFNAVWFLAVAVLFLSWSVTMVLELFTHPRLLRDGDVAIGQVSKLSLGRRSRSVVFTFSDSGGHLWKGKSEDRTRKLEEGMPVPVFYDRDNPKRHLAQCSTRYQVEIPNRA